MRLSRPLVASILAAALAATSGVAAASASTSSVPSSTAPAPVVGSGTSAAATVPTGDDTVPYHPQSTPAPVAAPTSPLLRESASPSLRAATAATPTTVHQLDIVVVDRGSVSKATSANVNSLVADVSKYWSAQTNGRVSFQIKTTKHLAVSASTGCSTDSQLTSLWSKASQAVAGKDWWAGGKPKYGPAAREHLVVLFPYDANDVAVTNSGSHETCDGTLGLGTTPAKASTGNNGLTFALFGSKASSSESNAAYYTARQSLAHELGHNLGLEHSSMWWCTSGANDGAFTSKSCAVGSYQDPFDPMGAGFGDNGIPPLSGPQKVRLGVLSSGQRTSVSGSSTTTTVNLAPVPTSEVGASSTAKQLGSIVDPVTHETYYVEYRSSMGGVTFPLTASQYPTYPLGTWKYGNLGYTIDTGVRIIRLAPSATTAWDKNEEMITPIGGLSTSTPRTSFVPVGKSFTTRSKGLTIAVTGKSASSASVRFTVNIHRPAVSMSRTATKQRYDQSAVTVTAHVASLSGKYSTGKVAFKDGSKTLRTITLHSSAKGTVKYTLPKSLSVRKHTITAAFTPDASTATRALSASTHTTVTVTKAHASVSAKLSHSTVKKHAKPKITVKISTKGISKPTGTLKIYVHGHKVKTVKVSASRHGKVTITLPKTTKRGTFTVVVKYSGTSKISSATSKTIKLHVK